MSTGKLQSAIHYGARGWRVFPQYPDSKVPMTKDWVNAASTNEADITTWFSNTPTANIALACGKESDLFVLDVDCKNGQPGFESLNKLISEHGALETRTIQTPSGGRHYYFKHPLGLANPIKNKSYWPGIDVKSDGGAITAPPSIIDGATYTVVNDVEPAECPAWLISELMLIEKTASYSQPLKSLQGFAQGRRNTGVFLYSCRLRALGNSKEEAWELVMKQAMSCSPPLPKSEAQMCLNSAWKYSTNFPLNDAGNAQRLIALFGDRLKFCPHNGEWLIKSGPIWIPDHDSQIIRFAKNTVETIRTEAANEQSEGRQKQLKAHARASGNKPKIAGQIKLAESELDVSVSVDDLDADPYLIGAINEVLDLRTGHAIVTEDVITKTVAVRSDSAAVCSRWLKFLDRIFDGNQELINYVQRAIGYSLTGSVEEQCLFFLHGTGANGKSTFINVIRHLFGDYAVVAPSSAFMSSKTPDNPAIAALQGARLVLASEVGEYSRLNETIVKQITGGDRITARFLYQGYFEYTPMFKVWIAGNHLPNVRGTDHAVWRRLKLLPFTVTIPEYERDPKMEEKLKQELPGILNWALEGSQLWLEGGLQEPECVTEATAQYRSSMDVLGTWIEDQCECGHTQSSSAKSLYDSYRYWAINCGEWVMTKRKFGLKLTERGFYRYKSNGVMHYKGISVKHDFYSMNG